MTSNVFLEWHRYCQRFPVEKLSTIRTVLFLPKQFFSDVGTDESCAAGNNVNRHPLTSSSQATCDFHITCGRQTISRVLYSARLRDRSGDHSSRLRVSPRAQAAYPETLDGPSMAPCDTAFPYLALLRVGFTKPIRYRTAGALLPHLFTLT